MKIFVALAAVALACLWWITSSDASRTAGGCPGVDRSSINLPSDKSGDMAPLLGAAEKLNKQGLCVIEGGWGSQTQRFYLTVQKPGQQPTFRRFTPAELYEFAV